MSGYSVTQRAFRFAVGSREFAIDVQKNIVFESVEGGVGITLYEMQPGGSWFMKYEEFGLPLLSATDGAIERAGGVVKFCEVVITRVNAALRRIFGAAVIAPPANLAEQVQQYLLANLVVTSVDGTPQLALRKK